MSFFKHKATFNDQGRTIFSVLKSLLKEVPLSLIEKLFRNKDVKINNKRIRNKKMLVKENDQIMVFGIYLEDKIEPKQQIPFAFEVIYEDQNVLIVNKPYDIDIHDGANCLDKQVLSYLNFEKKDSFVPSHIGRLDKKTTGVMLYAKNYLALRSLQQKNIVEKTYEFKSDLPQSVETFFKIFHDEKTQMQKCSDKFGKSTHTIFTVEKNGKFAKLKTGRKHQIRASLAKLGFPIYGDIKYKGKKMNQMYLHALQITFSNLKEELSYLNNRTFVAKKKWLS